MDRLGALPLDEERQVGKVVRVHVERSRDGMQLFVGAARRTADGLVIPAASQAKPDKGGEKSVAVRHVRRNASLVPTGPRHTKTARGFLSRRGRDFPPIAFRCVRG